MAQLLTGGARTIIPCVTESAYAVAAQGIYYVPCQDDALHVLNPVTLQDHLYGRLEKFENGNGGLAVSSDGQTILYTQLVNRGADLMLIQNFR